MWSLERAARLLIVLALAGLTGGCFTPLYGSATGGPGAPLQQKLASVDVAPIPTWNVPNGTRLTRVSVNIRNDLMFDLTGGGPAASPTHRLDIKLSASTTEIVVDVNTNRPDVENYAITATYTLTDIATGKVVVNSTTFSRVSYNIPGQQQRFAGQRGLQDAEDRAAKVIADNIRSRLASYFVAGT